MEVQEAQNRYILNPGVDPFVNGDAIANPNDPSATRNAIAAKTRTACPSWIDACTELHDDFVRNRGVTNASCGVYIWELGGK